MKVKGLDGKSYAWYLVGYQPKNNDNRPRSQFHLNMRELLRELFSGEKILEEVPLPGTNGLHSDFYLPLRKLMIEVQGRQHNEFVEHFHGNEQGFIASQKRDNNKRCWCELNGITLITCDYNEDKDAWRKRITEIS